MLQETINKDLVEKGIIDRVKNFVGGPRTSFGPGDPTDFEINETNRLSKPGVNLNGERRAATPLTKKWRWL